MDNFFAEKILNQLPGIVLVKNIVKGKSKYLWGNKIASQTLGYNSNDELVDIFEENIKCDAVAQNADSFLQHDITALNGETIQTIDVYGYAESDVIGLIGKKSPLYNEKNEAIGILFNALKITRENLLSNFILTLAQSNHHYSGKTETTFHLAPQTANLSVRESECLFHILRGKTSLQISKLLHRSPKTIESHIERIRYKLDVKDKAQLIEYAYHNNLMNFIPERFIASQANVSYLL